VHTPQARGGRVPACHENALCLLVWQLQDMHDGGFLQSLVSDLRQCRLSKDVDPAAIRAALRRCEAQVAAVALKLEETAAAHGGSGAEPPALQAERLQTFLEQAGPRLSSLLEGSAQLDASATALQRYFAEPPESTLPEMLRSLVSLLEALPAHRPGPAARRAAPGGAPRRSARRAAKPKALVRKALKTPGSATPRVRAGAKPAGAEGPLGPVPRVPRLALGALLERCVEEPEGRSATMAAPRRPVVPPLQLKQVAARAIAPACCGPPTLSGGRKPAVPPLHPPQTPPSSRHAWSESHESSPAGTTDVEPPQQAACLESVQPLRAPPARGGAREFLTPPAAHRQTPSTADSTRSHNRSECSLVKDAAYRSCSNSGESTAASTLTTPTSSIVGAASRLPSRRKLSDILTGIGQTPRSSATATPPRSPRAS